MKTSIQQMIEKLKDAQKHIIATSEYATEKLTDVQEK